MLVLAPGGGNTLFWSCPPCVKVWYIFFTSQLNQPADSLPIKICHRAFLIASADSSVVTLNMGWWDIVNIFSLFHNQLKTPHTSFKWNIGLKKRHNTTTKIHIKMCFYLNSYRHLYIWPMCDTLHAIKPKVPTLRV